MKKFIALVLAALMCLSCGCATTGGSKDVGRDVVVVTETAQVVIQQFNDMYAYLVAQKAVPDRLKEASRILALMDTIAPLVKQSGESLSGENLNYVQAVLQIAMIAVMAWGYMSQSAK